MKKVFRIIFLALLTCSLFSCNDSITTTVDNIDDQTINVISPTVTFITNGGSSITAQTTKVIKQEPQTKREHYLFDGWYFDEAFKSLAVFPLSVEYDTTLYAKWLKIYDTAREDDCSISAKSGYDSACTLDVSPPNFDFKALAERGLKLKITVSYDVSYQKKYDVLWDIGYAGAPHYEVYLLGEDAKGNWEEDVQAPNSAKTRSITMATNADYYHNNIVKLRFSTNNIQNIIHITNITVTYECGK